MEYMNRARQSQTEYETKRIISKSVTTKSFIYGIIEPNCYTRRSFLSEIHIYIYTYINLQTQSGDRVVTQSYTVQKIYTVSDCKYNQ